MAILKHIASKNANYGSAIDYLKYQHDEFHLVPVLDENGNMMLRDEFYLEGLNCDPETFDLECELLNQEYNKNNTYDEIKATHDLLLGSLIKQFPEEIRNYCFEADIKDNELKIGRASCRERV